MQIHMRDWGGVGARTILSILVVNKISHLGQLFTLSGHLHYILGNVYTDPTEGGMLVNLTRGGKVALQVILVAQGAATAVARHVAQDFGVGGGKLVGFLDSGFGVPDIIRHALQRGQRQI
jgi:hypothetical protein